MLFKFISIERVAEGVASADFFAAWPALERIMLAQNNIHALTQLDWLSKLAPQIKEVSRRGEKKALHWGESECTDDKGLWLDSFPQCRVCGVIPCPWQGLWLDSFPQCRVCGAIPCHSAECTSLFVGVIPCLYIRTFILRMSSCRLIFLRLYRHVPHTALHRGECV
jgi:hypothetical protein